MTSSQYEFFAYCEMLLQHHMKLADGEHDAPDTITLREKMKAQEAQLTPRQMECVLKISHMLFRGCAEK